METTEDRAAAAGHSVAVEAWLAEFDAGFAAIAGRFGRVEPRRVINPPTHSLIDYLTYAPHAGPLMPDQ